MSIQAMSWVIDHSPTKGTDRLVLLSIANHAADHPEDGAWEGFPGVATIQREARLDRGRTVQDSLARLVASGHLERIINGATDKRIRGDRRPNLYRVLMEPGEVCTRKRCGWCGRGVTDGDVSPVSGVTRDAGRGDGSRPDGVTRGDATGCRDASPEPSLNLVVQPSVEPTPLPPAASQESIPSVAKMEAGVFGRFWEVYPRKDDQDAAKRAWGKAVKRAAADRIIRGAEAYRDDPNRVKAYTKYAATWLNAGSWDNDPLPPRSRPQPVQEYVEMDRNVASGRLAL